MSYLIKEIFYSIQGEGVHSGRPAVFCRFAGCNLWSGREVDRENAVCKFCDTDFAGCDGAAGGNYSTAEKLIEKIEQFWPEKNLNPSSKFIICTGGEPLLQLNERLLSVLHERNWYVAVETNGTLLPPAGIDWVCVSPKAGAELSLRSGQELKLIFPQPGVNPERYEYLDFQHFFLQPLDSPEIEKNTRLALDYVLSHPRWRLSLQVHKILGIK